MKKASETQRLKRKPKDVVDFTEFQKNKYLLDNEFLYLKRVGNPIEYVECTYEELEDDNRRKKKAKRLQNKKKSLKEILNKRPYVEYITMSRNVI
jgi:hypothetical protein